jgi:hypothetical protein
MPDIEIIMRKSENDNVKKPGIRARGQKWCGDDAAWELRYGGMSPGLMTESGAESSKASKKRQVPQLIAPSHLIVFRYIIFIRAA